MKKSKFLLLALCALLLTGCSLARAEAGGTGGDRWIGMYVVPTLGYTNDFYDNPNLEEYGSESFDTGEFGTLTFPQEVLFAEVDGMKRYTFPGIEKGYSLFCVEEAIGGNQTTVIISNMGAHNKSMGITEKDEGTDVTLSGTVYCGPPLGAADWDPDGIVWHHYPVYLTKDGRVYLTSGGTSVNGSGSSLTQTSTYSYSENGMAVREETISVTVAIESVPRMERLVVTQFDENNAILWSEDLSLQNDRPEVHSVENAAWLLVEEIGPDGTQRAAYTVPEGEEPVSHDYVLLDDDGYGSPACLSIYGPNGYSR